MTLTATTNRVQYSGDGSTASFAVSFVYWDDTDIEAILTDANGTDTTWTDGTQYTLSGGSGATGTLTVSTSPTDYTPASGETLTIRSVVPNTQPDSIPLGGSLPSTTIEQRFDKLTRQVQQQEEELGRCIKFKATSAFSDKTTSDPVTGEYLRWKSDDTVESAALADTSVSAASADPTDTNTTRDKLGSNADFNLLRHGAGKQTDIASATTTTIASSSAQGLQIDITGTTTITSFGTAQVAGLFRVLQFDGALTLTHGANLNIPGDANITTTAGDTCLVYADTTTKWIVLQYFKADGEVLVNRKGADIASAATTDISGPNLYQDITGTTTITALGTAAAGVERILQFDGALTLTHNGTTLILPGAVNKTTAAGDVARFISEGSGNWRMVGYIDASKPLDNNKWTYSGSQDLTSGSPTAVSLASSLSDIHEIEIHVDAFSTNAANQAPMLQIGDSGGLETSGYNGDVVVISSSTAGSAHSSGFLMCEETTVDAAVSTDFVCALRHMGSNVWSMQVTGTHTGGGATYMFMGHGLKTLTAALDRVSITTSGGAATFDGGTAYIRYR